LITASHPSFLRSSLAPRQSQAPRHLLFAINEHSTDSKRKKKKNCLG